VSRTTSFADLSRGISIELPTTLEPIDTQREPMKTLTEIEAEHIARGEPVPPGLAMLAAEERSPDDDPNTSAIKVGWRGRKIQ
jgi:hypothetical protein